MANLAADGVTFVANDAQDVIHVHADHLGAPKVMTDDSRTVIWDAAFTPFGEEDSIVGAGLNNWRFPGQYAEAETGFHYNWLRHYDPSLGRYIQTDPIGLRGGLNTYAYVVGNPIKFTDRDGRFLAVVAPLLPVIAPEVAAAIAATAEVIVTAGAGIGLLWDDIFGSDDDESATDEPSDRICEFDNDDPVDDNECQKRFEIEQRQCDIISKKRDKSAGARCHRTAMIRCSECLRYEVGGIRTLLDTWNN